MSRLKKFDPVKLRGKYRVTEKRILANRANALKSTGPRTAEGKAKAALNGLKHVTLARTILLRCEDPAVFRNFAEGFHKEFKPRTATEKALVNTIATARWRLMRMSQMEAVNLDAEYVKQIEPAVVPADFGAADKAGLAYRDLTRKSRVLDMVGRNESRLQKQFDSALSQLMKLRPDGGVVPVEAPQSADELSGE